MMYWGSGWGAAGGVAMMIGMIAVTVLVVGGLVLLLRPVFGRAEYSRSDFAGPDVPPQAGDGGSTGQSSGLDLLDRRYARGEIERDEYLQRRRNLLEHTND